MKRGNGILLAVSSLPGKYGIGTMGESAREFIDQMHESAQSYWQVLPLSPTGYGDSPYQSVSVFAGNPYFIDFGELYAQGLFSAEELLECETLFGADEGFVDYALLFEHKERMLRKAYMRGIKLKSEEFRSFAEQNSAWLEECALYMAIKAANGLKPFTEWPEDLANAGEEALKAAKAALYKDVEYHAFIQYLFFSQWQALKDYANAKGVHIIGDMPIYIAKDSADAWLYSCILNKSGEKAGCPPDYFSQTGQLWGNPVYDWAGLGKQGYDWWINRVRHNLKLFDYLRIDHFRGFEAYYSIPAQAETAECGEWVKGPGTAFFEALKAAFGELPFIAEDLGYLTPEVHDLLKQTGFPGLKVLQFAFEPGAQSIYLPYRYERNCVVYTGTHDNDTTVGWYRSIPQQEKDFIEDYIGDVNEDNIQWKLIRIAMGSVADTCILPMQDLLGLPSEARMNTPQTSSGNWVWRLKSGQFNEELRQKLRTFTLAYGR